MSGTNVALTESAWLATSGNRPGVTCIIPAYNEGERIAAVLHAVEDHPWVDQIIIVNDGSIDNTADVARTCRRAERINLSPNRGKSFAVMKGIEAAEHDVIMMLDADLIGLTHDDIKDLLRPVLGGESDITISLRRNAFLIYQLMGVDFVSGERVFRKEVLGDYRRLAYLEGFGLEVFLNQEAISQNRRIRIVKWRRVRSVQQIGKAGLLPGLKLEAETARQLVATVGWSHVFYQIWRMNPAWSALRVKYESGRKRKGLTRAFLGRLSKKRKTGRA